MRTVTGLFGRSPFKPMAEHAERVHQTVVLIPELLNVFMDQKWDETQGVYERISRLEHKADIIKNDIRDHLPKSMFLPVDRGDVLLFLKEQDGIADSAEDLAVILSMRRTPTPEEIRNEVMEFAQQVVATSELWFQVASELPVLQEASFTGPEVDKTMKRIKEVSDMEYRADQLQWSVSRRLFEYEEDLGATSVMIWMHALQVLGGVANHAENTADLLRLMLARR